MLDEVIEALDVMVDRMTRAIDFSRGFENGATTTMSLQDAFDFHDKAIADHAAWHGDYDAAADSLVSLGFRRKLELMRGSLTLPQIAFSEVPVVGRIVDDMAERLWVLGSGECPWTETREPDDEEPLFAGEIRVFDADEDEIKNVSNLFDVSTVSRWEEERDELAAVAQQMRDIRFAIALSSGQPANAVGPHVGRPPVENVQRRRKEVQELLDKDFSGPQIINALKFTYPGFKKHTLEDDKRALKGKK